MALNLDVERLKDAIARFTQCRVLVVGDVMLDEFVWGRVRRISPEAPVPVVEVDRQTYMLGGAANVLHNLVALGGQAEICGLIGGDRAGRRLLQLLDELEVSPQGLVVCPQRPTTLKTRVVAHGQQVVRVDHESTGQAKREQVERLLDYVRLHGRNDLDAVIISDYAKGAVNAALMDSLRPLLAERGWLLVVDPKVLNLEFYQGATVVTPNHLEAAAAAGIAPQGPDYVQRAGEILLERFGFPYVLITEGEHGMTLFSRDDDGIKVPTAAKKVFDVTGAGDSVISTLTLGMCAGLKAAEAAVLANLAAGVVVGEVGTSAVTPGQLLQALEEASRRWRERK